MLYTECKWGGSCGEVMDEGVAISNVRLGLKKKRMVRKKQNEAKTGTHLLNHHDHVPGCFDPRCPSFHHHRRDLLGEG